MEYIIVYGGLIVLFILLNYIAYTMGKYND